MKQSETIPDLAAALCAAQATFPTVPKRHSATVPTKTGGSYSYDYADYGDVIDAVKPHLTANGLAVSQLVEFDGNRDRLVTILMHSSGQWIRATSRLPGNGEGTPQAQGSMITYAKRYALCAILGVVADSDDDGTLAQMAYGEGTGARRSRPPRSSTSTSQGRRPVAAVEPGSPGTAGMTAAARNKIVKALSQLPDPIREMPAVLNHLSALLDRTEPLSALPELTAEEGERLYAVLGIEG